MILNLTRHPATREQAEAGVVDLPAPQRDRLIHLLDFGALPTPLDIERRAIEIASMARDWFADHGVEGPTAMIGGAPYLMSALERALREDGIRPVYSFSTRQSVEILNPDGTVEKKSVFRHAGFVTPPNT